MGIFAIDHIAAGSKCDPLWPKRWLGKTKKNAHMYFYIEETIKTFQISRFQVLVKLKIFLEYYFNVEITLMKRSR